MKLKINENKIDEILNRGTIVEILPDKKNFRERLLSGERMRFYIGFDATAPTLHLSHAKNIMLMEKFRKLGHEIIILFGDFTAKIGDPTGEASTRKQLSSQEIKENIKKWKNLISPLIDFHDSKNPPKIKYNSAWLAKLTFDEIIDLASNLTIQQIIERDMFQKRIKEGKPIHLHEFLYPLMQGYDSVVMDVDVEVCGTDQIFNALVGRTLLKKIKNKEKFVVVVTLMANRKTGELMSKSKGNGVFLDSSADNMYGQIMAQPDEMIEPLFINNTELDLDEIKKILTHQMIDAKKRVAYEITKIFNGEKKAKTAEKNFEKTFSKKEIPNDLTIYKAKRGENWVDFLTKEKLVSSKSDAKRLIDGGGVDVNGKKIERSDGITESGVVKIGKFKFIKIEVK